MIRSTMSMVISSPILDEVEVEAGGVLELKASLHAARLPTRHIARCHEADDLEIFAKLGCVPHLAVLCLQRRSAPRLGVDFGKAFTTDLFSLGGHVFVLLRLFPVRLTTRRMASSRIGQ